MLLKLQTYGGITDARRLKFLVSTSKSESKSREKPSWPKSSSNQRWQVKSHSHGYFNGKIIGHGFQHVFHYQRLLSFTFHHHCEMQFIFLTKMLTHTQRTLTYTGIWCHLSCEISSMEIFLHSLARIVRANMLTSTLTLSSEMDLANSMWSSYHMLLQVFWFRFDII